MRRDSLPGLCRVTMGESATRIRRGARRLRRGWQKWEAALRKLLPVKWGGRFRPSDVTGSLITPAEYWRLRGRSAKSTRPVPADGFWLALRHGPRVVAAGAVLKLWAPFDIPGHWITATWVTPDLRRRGLGILLTRSLIEEARKRGWEPVYANVEHDNTASIGSLQAAGFMVIQASDWSRAIAEHRGRPGERQVILRHSLS